MSAENPGVTLSTTETPVKPKARTMAVPKHLKEGGRRDRIAKHIEKHAPAFDKVDAEIEKAKDARLDRLSSSKGIKHFKPSDRNKKADPADVAVDAPAKTSTVKESLPVERVAKVVEKPVGDKKEPTEKTESVAEKTVGGKSETTEPAETPGLPDEHVRSLKAFGVSDEDIKEGLETNPKMFANMAKMMHAARKAEVEKFAELGRVKKGTEIAPQAAADSTARVQPAPTSGMKPIDIAALKKQYNVEGDPLLDAILGPVNQMIEANNAAQQARLQGETALLAKQVDAFFAKDDLKIYAEEYKDTAKREAVLRRATDVLNGTRLSGRQVSLDEALQMAHDTLAAPKVREAARKELTEEAKKRAAGLTQRPSQSVVAPSDGKQRPAKNRKELLDRTAQRLKAFAS